MKLLDFANDQLELDLAGWSLTGAMDISPDGQWIVGYGINPTGQTEGFRLQLAAIPEPSTYAALAGLGALGLAVWRRRKMQAT